MAEATGLASNDPWDWPQMLYCARVHLKIRSEEEFWRMRPRTFFALLNIAIKANSTSADDNDDDEKLNTIDNLEGF